MKMITGTRTKSILEMIGHIETIGNERRSELAQRIDNEGIELDEMTVSELCIIIV